eukprot:CAMPEP_0115566272 /NCGR_PEP_ID=MMETSP0271-20121206/103500_1 /TAXON_ID=71861 /ORGANISM="Scrippsiella trochoidea, Strain CCMP3099" /LENGTH=219 /DNA_ID=CAMNT_0003000577 /DNA_START=402 /DNA_END=1059 /DNA_ORIENTATION=-
MLSDLNLLNTEALSYWRWLDPVTLVKGKWLSRTPQAKGSRLCLASLRGSGLLRRQFTAFLTAGAASSARLLRGTPASLRAVFSREGVAGARGGSAGNSGSNGALGGLALACWSIKRSIGSSDHIPNGSAGENGFCLGYPQSGEDGIGENANAASSVTDFFGDAGKGATLPSASSLIRAMHSGSASVGEVTALEVGAVSVAVAAAAAAATAAVAAAAAAA